MYTKYYMIKTVIFNFISYLMKITFMFLIGDDKNICFYFLYRYKYLCAQQIDQFVKNVLNLIIGLMNL